MKAMLKMLGGLVLISLFVGHLILLTFFLAPPPKLLGLAIESENDFLSASDVPPLVEQFLTDNRVGVEGGYQEDNTFGDRLVFGILELRQRRFMSSAEQLALSMNLLDYGEGIVGLGEASDYYFKKPLSEISDAQWITLVNLQKIFSKK